MKSGSYLIFLRRLELQVSIGLHPDERAAPQRLFLSAAMMLQRQGPGDRNDAVVDYDFLRDAAIRIASERHWDLQESLCEAVAEAAIEGGASGVLVESAKPDIYPEADAVGCRLARVAPGGPETAWLLTLPL